MDAAIYVAIGTISGVLVALLIKAISFLFKNGYTEGQLTFAGCALIAATLTPAAIFSKWFSESVRPQAVERLTELEFQSFEITDTLMPGCARILDAGFTVRYRISEQDRVGRICRRISGGEWTWYQDTNNLNDR